jgi:hypothetical protein
MHGMFSKYPSLLVGVCGVYAINLIVFHGIPMLVYKGHI